MWPWLVKLTVPLIGTFHSVQFYRSFDVTPDGQRFLVVLPEADVGQEFQIQVVQNWHQELLERVPVD